MNGSHGPIHRSFRRLLICSAPPSLVARHQGARIDIGRIAMVAKKGIMKTVVTIVLLSLTVTGITAEAAPAPEQARYGGTFVFGQGGEPRHLNPALAIFGDTQAVAA